MNSFEADDSTEDEFSSSQESFAQDQEGSFSELERRDELFVGRVDLFTEQIGANSDVGGERHGS